MNANGHHYLKALLSYKMRFVLANKIVVMLRFATIIIVNILDAYLEKEEEYKH